MDNALLLDTSVVSIFLKSSSVHATRLQKIQQELTDKVVFISLVTVAELLFWAEKRSWGEKRRTELGYRLRTFGVLAPTRAAAEIWAETKNVCEKHGVPSSRMIFGSRRLRWNSIFRSLPRTMILTVFRTFQ